MAKGAKLMDWSIFIMSAIDIQPAMKDRVTAMARSRVRARSFDSIMLNEPNAPAPLMAIMPSRRA